jgi:hypothetical protein
MRKQCKSTEFKMQKLCSSSKYRNERIYFLGQRQTFSKRYALVVLGMIIGLSEQQ